MGEDTVKYFHGDLNDTQIIFNPIDKKWYLVDFGNSRLSFQDINQEFLVPQTTVIQTFGRTTSKYSVRSETEKLLQSFLPGTVGFLLMKLVLSSHKELVLSLIQKQARRQVCLAKLEKLLETEKAKHKSAEKGTTPTTPTENLA